MNLHRTAARGGGWCIGVGMVVAGIVAGCATLRDVPGEHDIHGKWAGCPCNKPGPDGTMHGPRLGVCESSCDCIPRGSIPAPMGTYVNEFERRQAAKAEADDFVIYKNEWLDGGITLGPYGSYHLDQIVHRLESVPFPVLIQIELDPKLNESRRQVIVTALAMAGIPAPDRRVVVGFPAAEGLFGEEALRIYTQMVTNPSANVGQIGGLTGFGGFGGGFGGMGGFGGLGAFGAGTNFSAGFLP